MLCKSVFASKPNGGISRSAYLSATNHDFFRPGVYRRPDATATRPVFPGTLAGQRYRRRQGNAMRGRGIIL